MSQSLLLFRAFQRKIYVAYERHDRQSQSLLLFRAFQPRISPLNIRGANTCRNPFFYSGHFNTRLSYPPMGIAGKSQSLLLFRAFQLYGNRGNVETYFMVWSQSLLLFRAFQRFAPSPFWRIIKRVAIPSFIQGISTVCPQSFLENYKESRNPFFYSGHFNQLSPDGDSWKPVVAIPSFIQGISTTPQGLLRKGVLPCRNPFFYSGHFNLFNDIERWRGYLCRNPFFYSGHFNILKRRLIRRGI